MLRFGRRCFLEAGGVVLACTMLAWIMAWIHGEAWGRLEGLVFLCAVSRASTIPACVVQIMGPWWGIGYAGKTRCLTRCAQPPSNVTTLFGHVVLTWGHMSHTGSLSIA